MKRWLILFTISCLVLSGAASASVQQGDTELDFLGGWMSQNGEMSGGDIDIAFLAGGIGYFLTDNVQVQAVALGAWTEIANTDIDIYGLGARAKYHFMPTNLWVPYVGGQILWADLDVEGAGDTDATLWGPVAGLRYELNAYNDFFVEYQYHVWDGDISSLLDDGHGLFVGLIHQFK